MNPVTLKERSQAIVYDGDVLAAVGPGLFDPDRWRREGGLQGFAPGRGTTWFVKGPFGRAALRRYLRGGWVARLSRDRYLFLGFGNSRPFREFHLLRRMRDANLRVPAPLAAWCARSGLWYRGALLTRRIEPARPLPERFTDPALDWSRVGAGLREFHDAGMEHADLNAHNILIADDGGDIWLLDLDRSRFQPGRPVDGRRNLARLKRSLEKLWPAAGAGLETCWLGLLAGYEGS